MTTTQIVSVTAFGETREVEVSTWGDGTRYESRGYVVVGKFPTGTKLHRACLTLWKRHQERNGTVYSSPPSIKTAAVIDGVEYVMDTTLYIHNSNRGRIVAWNDEKWDAVIGKWN